MAEEFMVKLGNRAIPLGGSVDRIDVGGFIEMNVVITFMSIDSCKGHPRLKGCSHLDSLGLLFSNQLLVRFVEDTVTDREYVEELDLLGVRDDVTERHIVGLIDRVNGQLVASGDRLTVWERVNETDTVADTHRV